MAYFAPFIDAAGLHLPTYADIRDQMVSDAKTIFGNDLYLENDSQDYQLISANAIITFDALQALQLAYNSRSPVTAIGSALDAVVKINGIQRKAASFSTCLVNLSGSVGTTITNGVVKDVYGNLWNLPSSVILFTNPTSVYVTSAEIGNIQAAIGDISLINTPTAGWTGVTNPVEAVVGLPVETDAQLRARQAISTAIPSQTLLEGINAGIGSVSGVSRWVVYENDTNTPAVYGEGDTGHSITCVVEGGSDEAVAEQIYSRKGIGCYTNGTTLVNLTDAYNRVTPIRFFRPTLVYIDVALAITAHAGYSATIEAAIKQAVFDYLNGLEIGTDLVISAVQYAAMAANPSLTRPAFSIDGLTICKHGGTPGTSNIDILFNEVTAGNLSYITIT